MTARINDREGAVMGKYQSRKVAQKMKRENILGTICCNCGADVGDKIEYHHIVPLERGGRDVASNIAPLCYDCHSLCSFGKKRKVSERNGRRRKEYDPKLLNMVFTKYINGDIMEVKAREVLGTGQKIREMAVFKEWAEKHGIDTTKRYHFGRGGPQH